MLQILVLLLFSLSLYPMNTSTYLSQEQLSEFDDIIKEYLSNNIDPKIIPFPISEESKNTSHEVFKFSQDNSSNENQMEDHSTKINTNLEKTLSSKAAVFIKAIKAKK